MGRSKKKIKYIYAVKSVAFPGLIKIGRTQNMKERLSQLNTSCAPAPFVVVAVSPTLDNVRDERIAHEFFSLQRREGEFFSVPELEVMDFFKTIQEKFDLESIQPWVEDPAVDAAKEARVQAFCRFLCGGLVKQELEREGNMSCVSQAEFDSSSVQHQEPVQQALDDSCRKRKRDTEDLLLEMERIKHEKDLKCRQLQLVVRCLNGYQDMCKDTVMDNQAKSIFKDLYLNMAMQYGRQGVMITNGEVAPSKRE
jgi:hypothetical protein